MHSSTSMQRDARPKELLHNDFNRVKGLGLAKSLPSLELLGFASSAALRLSQCILSLDCVKRC